MRRLPLIRDLRSDPNAWLRLLCVSSLWFCAFLALDRGLAAFLSTGLERYFGLDQPAQILCVGHSRSGLSIDEQLLSERLGAHVAKFTMDGVQTSDREAMVRFALERHPAIRVVVYGVESTSFASSGLSANTYKLFLPFMDDTEVDKLVRPQCNRSQYVLCRLVRTARFDEAHVNRSLRGWLGVRENLKIGQVNQTLMQQQISGRKARPVRVRAGNLAAFMRTVDFVTSSGRKLLLWHPPTIDLMDDVEHEKREAVRRIFRNLADENPGVYYLEYVEPFRDRHELFYDAIHVNAEGKRAVSEALALDIAALGTRP